MNDSEENRKRIRVAKLVTFAQGNRSGNRYAELAGISPAHLTRIKNGDYIPSPEVIAKLTSVEADPQGGVTYEELMKAAGYVSKESEIEKKMDMYTSERPTKKTNKENTRKEKILRYKEYEEHVRSNVFTRIAEKGIVFLKIENMNSENDLSIQIRDRQIKQWDFEFKYMSDDMNKTPIKVFDDLAFILRRHFSEQCKLSVIVNSLKVFQFLERYEHEMPIRGEVSVLYYNEASEKIEKEIYLSNYIDGDYSREIYIV